MCSTLTSVVNCKHEQMLAQKDITLFIWCYQIYVILLSQNWQIVCLCAFCRDTSAQKSFCIIVRVSLGTLDCICWGSSSNFLWDAPIYSVLGLNCLVWLLILEWWWCGFLFRIWNTTGEGFLFTDIYFVYVFL